MIAWLYCGSIVCLRVCGCVFSLFSFFILRLLCCAALCNWWKCTFHRNYGDQKVGWMRCWISKITLQVHQSLITINEHELNFGWLLCLWRRKKCLRLNCLKCSMVVTFLFIWFVSSFVSSTEFWRAEKKMLPKRGEPAIVIKLIVFI